MSQPTASAPVRVLRVAVRVLRIADLVLSPLLLLAVIPFECSGLYRSFFARMVALFPCGETYRVHPSCRLADPGAVDRGVLLVATVPVVCLVLGIVATTLLLIRRRPGVIPAALTLAVAVVAEQSGTHLLDTALHDLVPW